MKKFWVLSVWTVFLSWGGLQASDHPKLIDIGVIGLSSHDLIAWDRETQSLREERGRLDLGTIFDFVDPQTGETRWEKGGDPKNSENAVVFSVVQQLLSVFYVERDLALAVGASEQEAFRAGRLKAIEIYHQMLKLSYERLFGLPFPKEPIHGGVVDAEEHAAMRAAHHILPGKMLVSFGPMKREIVLTDFRYALMNLSAGDLQQEVKKYDGRYEPEYLNFSIPFGPRAGEEMNLYEIDRDFVETHTEFHFDEMLSELAEKQSFEGVSFASFIHSLYAEGLSGEGNEWLE